MMESLQKRAKYGLSLIVIIAVSCLMALMFYPMMNAQVRELPVAVLSVMLALMNIALPLGVLCGVLGLGLGMTSGLFPYELLPGFWRDWVYGWVPQRYIGDGVRAVLYSGDGWWNAASEPLMVVVCVGLVVFVVAGLLPLGKRSRD